MGDSAATKTTTGHSNTALGFGAMSSNTEGSENTVVGSYALLGSYSGNQNTVVGAYAGPGNGLHALSNTGVFGFAAQVTANNTIRIGNSSIIQIGGSVPWSNLSDRRYKTNVKQNVPGLDFIKKLKPVTFNWDLSKLNEGDGSPAFASDAKLGEAREAKARKVYTGFIAQDVEAAAEQCGFDFSGVVKPENERSQYQLAYSEFVVPLVQAVQEQQKAAEAQQKEIEALRETVKGLSSNRPGALGSNAGEALSRHAGMLGDSFGGAMALLSAVLVMLHLKRRRVSPAAN